MKQGRVGVCFWGAVQAAPWLIFLVSPPSGISQPPWLLTLQQSFRDAPIGFQPPGHIAAVGAGGTQAPLNHIALRDRIGELPVHPEALTVSGPAVKPGQGWAWRQWEMVEGR